MELFYTNEVAPEYHIYPPVLEQIAYASRLLATVMLIWRQVPPRQPQGLNEALQSEFLSLSCAVTALVTAALGTASLSLCGLYCNHADLSPRYAPFLLGMTNTIGALPGIIGVAVTGAILDVTGARRTSGIWHLQMLVADGSSAGRTCFSHCQRHK